MSTREKGRKRTKQEASTKYKVTDPISMADLENIHLRKGKSYPNKPWCKNLGGGQKGGGGKNTSGKKRKSLKYTYGDYLHRCHGYRGSTGN